MGYSSTRDELEPVGGGHCGPQTWARAMIQSCHLVFVPPIDVASEL